MRVEGGGKEEGGEYERREGEGLNIRTAKDQLCSTHTPDVL